MHAYTPILQFSNVNRKGVEFIWVDLERKDGNNWKNRLLDV